MTGRFERLRLGEQGPLPFRRMLDGSPCWCVSTDAPHDGWIHAPRCLELRARIAADPFRPTATDDQVGDVGLPPGSGCALAFVGWLVLMAFVVGAVAGRITA